MANKGGRHHLKKLSMPKSWIFQRKDRVWVAKPKPGAHALAQGLPLVIVMKELLGLAKTTREAKKVLNDGKITVDGRVVKASNFSVGLMDVIAIPSEDKQYRVFIDHKGRLVLRDAPAKEKNFKLCRVENKTTLAGKRVQIGLHDGRTLLTDKNDFVTGDVLKISVPDQKVLDYFKFAPGSTAFFVTGKHIGKIGKIKQVVDGTRQRAALITAESGGETFSTLKNSAFVLGREKSEITV